MAACVLLCWGSSCVGAKKYEAALADARAARGEAFRQSTESATSLQGCRAQEQQLQRDLDEQTALNDALRRELEHLGTDTDALLAEKGALSSALGESRSRLEELRNAQAAAQARLQLYRQITERLRRMIDAGELHVSLREGCMVLQLPNDVLFDTGHTELKPRGKAALEEVATVLADMPERRFVVTGHTDDVPIATARYRSNWELSAARGLAVVHLLIARGVSPASLAAAGYGEFDPVAPNKDEAGRAQNRRIEITLQPNVDELIGLPDPE